MKSQKAVQTLPITTIIGPYQKHNFGDDLIGAVIASFLNGNEGVNMAIPGLKRDNAEWLGLSIFPRRRDAVLAADCIVIGGGGILGNSGRRIHSGYFKLVMKTALAAWVLRKRCAIVGVGAGPIKNWDGRFYIKMASRMTPFIGVRDKESAEFLTSELGVTPTKIYQGADLALLWPELLGVKRGSPDGGGIGVQFTVRGYEEAERNPMLGEIEFAVEQFCHRNIDRIVFLSNSSKNEAIVQKFPNCRRILNYDRLPDFLEGVSSLGAILTSHLHLAIAAYAAGVPSYSIYVKDKNRRFFTSIGRDNRAISIKEANVSAIETLLQRVGAESWADKDDQALAREQAKARHMLNAMRTSLGL